MLDGLNRYLRRASKVLEQLSGRERDGGAAMERERGREGERERERKTGAMRERVEEDTGEGGDSSFGPFDDPP